MKQIVLAILVCLAPLNGLLTQEIEQTVEERLRDYFQTYSKQTLQAGQCRLDSCHTDFARKRLSIYAAPSFAYQPLRPESVAHIYQELRQLLPGPVNYFQTTIYCNGRSLEDLIPNYYRKGKRDRSRLTESLQTDGAAWVNRISRPYSISQGLEGRHIALWQSHGKYYNNRKGCWEWQRPRLFCTTEDQFTQSFVLPYLIPMLENAGAVVFTPRERDTQRQEVIVDNDGSLSGRGGTGSLYLDVSSKKARWQATAQAGFAQRQRTYQERENPFGSGTARYTPTERKPNKAFAEWVPDLPESGEYAVYVTYQSMPTSVSDAKYLVYHNGGVTEFKVNQRMGGGTWVYLGTFSFDKGRNDYGMVVLSNESRERGVVCADAVRFGGGMGNIVRGHTTSGVPRYLEGARYTAQWYGMPYPVYAGYQGTNDMNDDINVRSRMTNYLSGGSIFNPTEEGLGIPIELSLALHSDAGFSQDDRFIGTLGIYTTDFNHRLLHAGTDRLASRDLADLMITQLQHDIQGTFHTEWTRRSLWDRNYSETRLPAIASTIIELLSHQNFADMRLGHDPTFKFTVGRALYKAILRYLSTQHGEAYTVQPLPVDHFAIRFGKKKNTVELSWEGVEDPLEPSATPREYIVYTRIGRGGFDNGIRVSTPSYTANIEPGIVYSFRVTAVNRGGESFPSETLVAFKAKHEKGTVLIVNGFDRVNGPATIQTPEQAGFNLNEDMGVPYLYDISYCGTQQEFDRRLAGKTLGDSGSEYEGMKLAGNSFDYPFIHGKAIQAAGGYSFVSCSDEAVERGEVRLEAYDVVDYLFGLQKQTELPFSGQTRYPVFTPAQRKLVTAYCQNGGRLLVSGAYIAQELSGSSSGKRFLQQTLKADAAGIHRTASAQSVVKGLGQAFTYLTRPNEQMVAVPSSDCLQALAPAFPALIYGDTQQPAAIAYRGSDYRSFLLAFPFESIQGEAERNALMASALHFLTGK